MSKVMPDGPRGEFEAGLKLQGVSDAWLRRATKADIERVAVF